MAMIFKRIFGGADGGGGGENENGNGKDKGKERASLEEGPSFSVRYVNQHRQSSSSSSSSSPSPATVQSRAIHRRYLRGHRGSFKLDFSHLSWITQPEDMRLVRMVCNVAVNCAIREQAAVKDVSVHDDTPEEEREAASGNDNLFMLYRIVVSLCGNVPVSKKALDTIEHANPARIESIGVATYVPDDVNSHNMDEITTQIVIYVRSADHQKLKKEIESNTLAETLRPASQIQAKKRKRNNQQATEFL